VIRYETVWLITKKEGATRGGNVIGRSGLLFLPDLKADVWERNYVLGALLQA
jgi:hypothetical protein